MSLEKLFENLGLPTDGIEPMKEGEPSVPVNSDKLRKFYSGQLDHADSSDVAYLITHERAWFEESTRVMLQMGKDAIDKRDAE